MDAIHRLTITRLLGEWGDPRAIPVLRQTLQACWDLEQRPRSQGGRSDGYLRVRYSLEYDLAYALGQLEAWDALEGLGLSPAGFHVARLYLVLGSLRANVDSLSLYGGDILRLISLGTDAAGELWRRRRRADVRRSGRRANESTCDEPESLTANARPYPRKRRLKGWPVVSGTIDPGPVLTLLQERYGMNEREGLAELQQFQLWHQERAGRRGQIFPSRETIDETIICYRIIEKCRRQHWYGPDMCAPWGLQGRETDLLQMPIAWTFADAPLTEEQLQSAERRLGFALPSLLWAIYTRVANGGFGPGYGLYPLEMLVNSYGRGAGRLVDFHLFEKQAADKKLIFMPHDVWPDGFLCLCYWGCTSFSYFELATGRVFRQDYYVGEQYGFEVEAPTLEAWFEGWLAREIDLFSKTRYGVVLCVCKSDGDEDALQGASIWFKEEECALFPVAAMLAIALVRRE